MTWQPIETAPKDGRTVIVSTWGYEVGAAYWTRGTDAFSEGWKWSGDGWRSGYAPRLTHWMPLPSPPCPDCHETKTAGERAADGAPLVCTACQGGRR